MEFNFKIQNDRLEAVGSPSGVTGNINTYVCNFDITCNISDLIWFCVFKQGSLVYDRIMENNTCLIPYEVLKNPEPLYIGCFGKKADGEIKQVSTNMVYFDLKQGAYEVGDIPAEPPEDAYTILLKSLKAPYIGENGNWYEWNAETLSYVDTGVSANGGGEAVTDEQIQEAVNNYLEENPVEAGATKEQAEQIQANTEGIAQLTEGLQSGEIVVDKATEAQEAVDCQNANYASVANVAEFDMDMNRFTEHYATKEELKALKFIKVMNELPETGEEGYIYLIPKYDEETSDVYDEYVWVNNSWEYIGTKQIEIDLTGYATIEYVNNKIGDIETALDHIIAIQNELMGGDSE